MLHRTTRVVSKIITKILSRVIVILDNWGTPASALLKTLVGQKRGSVKSVFEIRKLNTFCKLIISVVSIQSGGQLAPTCAGMADKTNWQSSSLLWAEIASTIQLSFSLDGSAPWNWTLYFLASSDVHYQAYKTWCFYCCAKPSKNWNINMFGSKRKVF